MLTTEGKEKVLNPQGRKPIAKIDWQPNVYTKKVQERVRMYVSEYLQSKDQKNKRGNIIFLPEGIIRYF